MLIGAAMYEQQCTGMQEWESKHAQSIPIAPQTFLIAAPDGRSWLLEIPSSSLIALKASAVAAKRSTLAASLIEGAITAGLMRSASPSRNGAFSWQRYIRWAIPHGNALLAQGTTFEMVRPTFDISDADTTPAGVPEAPGMLLSAILPRDFPWGSAQNPNLILEWLCQSRPLQRQWLFKLQQT
jgi:hypothetical protein